MAAIRLYHVVKKIEGKKVLDDVTLEIEEGELICLLGYRKV